MSKHKSISLSLVLLAFLCFQAQAFNPFDAHSFRKTILNAYATDSGVVELRKESPGDSTFYVEADLSYYPFSSSNHSNSSTEVSVNGTKAAGTVRMMVSIANSETMVATNCFSFSNYDCSQYSGCSKYSTTRSIDFPSFTANTFIAQSKMYLDYTHWSLASSNYLYIAYSCSNDGKTSVGTYRYGVIGLGTTGNSGDDFTFSKVFSIYLGSDLSTGKLVFKNDAAAYAKSSNAALTLYANSNWQVSLSGATIQIPGYTVYFGNGNLMFDINSNDIGLPYMVYVEFVKNFAKSIGGPCGSDMYWPKCYFPGKPQDLPDINLVFGTYNLTIPAKIYAGITSEESTQTIFYLNVKATSPSLTGISYVTPSFQNSLILGQNFMRYYYTVFDASSGYNIVSLYRSINSEDPNSYYWLIFGVLGAFVLVGLCCYCCKNKKGAANQKDNINTVAVNNTSDVVYNNNNTGYQAPPPQIYNQSGPGNYLPNGYNHYGGNDAQEAQGIQGIYPTFNNGYQQPQHNAPGMYHPPPQEYAKQ